MGRYPTEAELDAYAAEMADAAPPFSPAQLDRIAAALGRRPGRPYRAGEGPPSEGAPSPADQLPAA